MTDPNEQPNDSKDTSQSREIRPARGDKFDRQAKETSAETQQWEDDKRKQQ
jgi:hypothetical protein